MGLTALHGFLDTISGEGARNPNNRGIAPYQRVKEGAPAGQPLSTSNFQYILQNPIYYGLIRFRGENYDGKHEPLISKALFDRCQDVMHRRTKVKSPKLKPYVYRGVFRCGECGCFITTETQKGHNYLRCTRKAGPCSQPFTREERISEQVSAYLYRFSIPEAEADAIISELKIEQKAHAKSRQEIIAKIRAKIQAVNERISRLTEAYSGNVLSLEEFRSAKNELVIEKRGYEEEHLAVEKKRTTWLEPAIRFVSEAKQAVFVANHETQPNQRDFLRRVGSNLKITHRELTLEPRGAWKLVVDSGRVAQFNAAPEISAAAFFGELDQNLSKLGN